MSAANNGHGASAADARHNRNDDGGNRYCSPPVAIRETHNNDRGNDDREQQQLFEGAPLLSAPSSLLVAGDRSSSRNNNFLRSLCLPDRSSSSSSSNAPRSGAQLWGTDEFLSCSPMVSGPRTGGSLLRLPDLDRREARRVAAVAANNSRLLHPIKSAEFDVDRMELRRSRSRSLGSEAERIMVTISNHPSVALGEVLLKRKTPSGLSLMDLDGGIVADEEGGRQPHPQHHDVETNDNENNIRGSGYGATTMPATAHVEPLKEAPHGTMTMKTSQSCTIHDLNPTPPPPTPGEKVSNGDREKSLLEELKLEFDSQSNPPVLSLLYGLVNASICLPVIMSFGSIIYHDDFFRPYLSVLMKLTAVSGAVHQMTFSTFSSLPFAVGQVQDAGLIFLSAMARDLVSRLRSMGVDDKSILATVTIGLSLYTAALGLCLMLVGRFKLASYCQLLPSSVIAGYLAYIGFFCGQAALALMTSTDVTGLGEWYKFMNGRALILLAPGVMGGCAIYFSVRAFRHMAVLPSCIMMLMVVFYATLWATGTSVEEATDNGWINKAKESPSWYHTWDYLNVEKVVWSVLPSQTLTIIAMICVVALSSSLDIAAIEIELKRPLDYNHELKTVGISNVISGLTGGYTGSYIFSQTIFSLRMGIRSRLMGYLLAFISILAVAMPFNILAYVPNFFFGSLLILICLDLMFEWLIDVRGRVTPAEYVIVLGTFALLQVLGVAFGIVGGCVLYLVVRRAGYDVGSADNTNEDELAIADYGM